MKIALFGKMRSGKDTVAKILIEEYGFTRYGFGDGIGRVIKEYFPEAWAGGKPRGHYQFIGQQFRKLNEYVWIDYTLNTIFEDGRPYRIFGKEFNVVIADGRQLNEAKRLKEAGYLIVKVETPEELRIQRMKELGDVFSPEQLNHETELQVDMIEPDVLILNDGTLEELEEKVQKMLSENKGGMFIDK